MQLSNGRELDFNNPNPELFDINTIAAHLSKICRWGGACQTFYSVAQHSVLLSRLAAGNHGLDALLHDAHEMVTGDVTRPLERYYDSKKAGEQIRELKQRIQGVIVKRYRLELQLPKEVQELDDILAVVEAQQMMRDANLLVNKAYDRKLDLRRANIKIQFWTPQEAYNQFMERYVQLSRGLDM